MNTTLITQGITVDQLLASVRDIVHDEIQSIPQPEKVKPFLTLSEACDLTGLSRSTIYRLTSEREIPHMKRGGKLLFNRVELVAWIQSASVGTNS
jgi:excisionase family DNA binding protein